MPLMPFSSSSSPLTVRTRMRKTTFSPRLNWLLSTQIGPVAPSAVLPRTMSPSMNSFCACWASAAEANPSMVANKAIADNLSIFIGSPCAIKDAARHLPMIIYLSAAL